MNSNFDLEADVGPERRAIYSDFLETLNANSIRYMIGGTFALRFLTGMGRPTKDFDVFIVAEDLDRALAALERHGYATEKTFPYWLAKVRRDGHYIDLIFRQGTKYPEVTQSWFEHSEQGQLFGVNTHFAPAEEVIWSKSYIMERERFDGHDIGFLLNARIGKINWRRLLSLFEKDWEILDFQLQLFRYMHPARAADVPAWLLDELSARSRSKYGSPMIAHDPYTYGTQLSRGQYLGPMLKWGYQDARLAPKGAMNTDEIEHWTNAISGIK